jgi:hypothetical protein
MITDEVCFKKTTTKGSTKVEIATEVIWIYLYI